MDKFNKLVFVDTETTGGNFLNDRIIDIGIIRVENGKIVRRFSSLIDPQQPVPAFIYQMTGIKPDKLEKAPTFREISDEIWEIMDGCIFVAHNSRFDYSLVRSEFRRLGIDFRMKQLCTVKLSKTLIPNENKHNLDAVIERYNLKCESRHRAMPDAQAVADFFFKAIQVFGEAKIKEAILTAMKHPNLPPALEENDIDELPEEPGVYIFYGHNGETLYIGKSINIKERIKSHFTDANRIQTEMTLAQNVASIETIPTGGELGVLLKEKSLIKSKKPFFNKKLREIKQLVFLIVDYKNGYKFLRMQTGEWPEGEIMGVFKNQTRAKDFLNKRVKKHKLCRVIMGIERLRQICFEREIGKCKGACEGSEDPIRYNMRFDMAFADSKVRSWPFGGPIMVTEKDDCHVFDRWCYLGKMNDLSEGLPELQFDIDTYKMINSYINKKDNWKKIKVIKK